MDGTHAGSGAAPAHPPTGGRRPNVIIVSVDCMRRDRVSAYGYPRQTTPFLDSLLDGAMHCTSAHSVSSWTCPAVVSLHTGLYPHHHGGGLIDGEMKNLSKDQLPTRLSAERKTLPEAFARAGYRTAAMIAVWNANLPLERRYQHQELLERPADVVVRKALRWIRDQDGQPFLLWLHLGDCHEPLDVPRSMREAFGPVPRGRAYRRWSFTHRSERVDTAEFERYRDARVKLYDASVLGVDAALSSLWSGLEAAGQRDRTILTVTADHGEEFWEHRDEEIECFADPRDIAGTGHGQNLFQVQLLIPLIVAGPGVPQMQVSANVSLIDVAPTLGELTGVEVSPRDGDPLFAIPEDRAILAEAIAYGHEKIAVVHGDDKLLMAPADGYERLFGLGPDRTEERVVDDPSLAARLREHVPTERSAMGEQVESDPEILEHLRELGYIE